MVWHFIAITDNYLLFFKVLIKHVSPWNFSILSIFLIYKDDRMFPLKTFYCKIIIPNWVTSTTRKMIILIIIIIKYTVFSWEHLQKFGKVGWLIKHILKTVFQNCPSDF